MARVRRSHRKRRWHSQGRLILHSQLHCQREHRQGQERQRSRQGRDNTRHHDQLFQGLDEDQSYHCWTYLILSATSFFLFYFWHHRQHPLPGHDTRTLQHDMYDHDNNFLVAAWFVEQAALQRVPFLFLCPEDFRLHSQYGPASPWSLLEFQRFSGCNDCMCRFADMGNDTTGMLTNIQGL